MKNKLPVLLSIPHGGTKRPSELDEIVSITDKDLFDDIDPFVVEIYSLENLVEKVIFAEIARTFVDLNRSIHDMPPKNPDGLVKSMTCYQKPIYLEGKQPNENLVKTLIDLHYLPYHRLVQKSVKELDLQLGIDCHSMASVAPNISPDGKQKSRPLFCISNQDGKTAPNEMLHELGKCIVKAFSIPKEKIKFNDPFKGGYITKTYGNNPIPWIQIEMNRELYLSPEWFDEKTLEIEGSRLKNLNSMFSETLKLFFAEIGI